LQTKKKYKKKKRKEERKERRRGHKSYFLRPKLLDTLGKNNNTQEFVRNLQKYLTRT
jgi:hypothetical protein